MPAWAAFALAAIALWISLRAQRDGQRSANAAEKSVTAAEASVEEARLSRGSGAVGDGCRGDAGRSTA